MTVAQVANLIQGVSQQAVQQRRDTQCEAQFDCINSVLEGAIPRPELDYVARLATITSLSNAFFYELIRGSENYLLGVTPSNLPFAINLNTGAEAVVTWGSPDHYLDSAVPGSGVYPKDQFRAQVVQDNVFLINRGYPPAMLASPVSASRNPEALINIKSGSYDTHFKLKLTSGANVAPCDLLTDPTNNSGANSTFVSFGLAFQINTTHAAAGFTAVDLGSVLHIYRADNADFTVESDDGNGNEFMTVCKERVTDFAKLPAKGVDGFIVAVSGQNRKKEDDYYVKFEGGPSTGAWNECPAPDIKTTLDPETMPHAFVLTGPNAFTFGTKPWSTRIAGDETTAPNPGFVGEKIRDVFYHQQRLGLLHENGAVWSKARYPYTYFADTVQTVLAEAPVDVTLIAASQSRGTTDMDFAVQFDETLSFWAPKAQFRVSWAQDGFRQETVDVPLSTAFEYSRICDPLGLGSFLYFAANSGQWSNLRSIQSASGKVRGDLFVTGHVPKYIRSGIRWLCGSETLGLVIGVSQDLPTVLYVWNYLFQGDEFVQSAWNTWRFPGGDILWAGFSGNILRVLQQRPNGVYLFTCNLTPGVADSGVTYSTDDTTYRTRLDLRLTEAQVTSMSYNSTTNQTTFTIPYNDVGERGLRVIVRESTTGPGSRKRGYEFPVVGGGGAPPGRTVVVTGNCTGFKFYVGCRISAERTESRFAVRGDKGVLPVDRLTLDRFVLELSNTGYTRVEVTTPKHAARPYEYQGRTSGVPVNSVLGAPRLGTDKLVVPLGDLAEDVSIRMVNDSFLPSAWQSAAYQYTAVGLGASR